jgi:hypothetical protein
MIVWSKVQMSDVPAISCGPTVPLYHQIALTSRVRAEHPIRWTGNYFCAKGFAFQTDIKSKQPPSQGVGARRIGSESSDHEQ